MHCHCADRERVFVSLCKLCTCARLFVIHASWGDRTGYIVAITFCCFRSLYGEYNSSHGNSRL